MNEYMNIAKADGRAIWCETSNEANKDYYERLGFRTMGEFVLGRGHVSEKGLQGPGGAGVKVWPMAYNI